MSPRLLVAPGPWRRAVVVRGTRRRGRRQSWRGLSCVAVGAHPGGSAVWGLPGGRGQAGDRRGSREDLGHHLVASLTAFPKSPTRRVTALRGQGPKEHRVLPGDSPAGRRDPCPRPRLARPLGAAGWDGGPNYSSNNHFFWVLFSGAPPFVRLSPS